jgi:hypothetical protein
MGYYREVFSECVKNIIKPEDTVINFKNVVFQNNLERSFVCDNRAIKTRIRIKYSK